MLVLPNVFSNTRILIPTFLMITTIATVVNSFPVGINLGVVCDVEFSQLFDFNEQRIQSFVLNQIWGMEINFQTLQKTKIKIFPTQILIIEEFAKQPFIENTRLPNGSTILDELYPAFSKWMLGLPIEVVSDAVLLITGSPGEYRSIYYTMSLCEKTNTSKKAVILRSGSHNLHEGDELTISVAKMIGAHREKEICDNNARIMSHVRCESQSHHYFSKSSDQQIYKYMSSATFNCLMLTTTNITAENILYAQRSMQSFEDQCALEYKNFTNVSAVAATATHNLCYLVKCMSSSVKLGFRMPFQNTPCGVEKACFRGQCISRGNVLKNMETGLCLTDTDPEFDFKLCTDYVPRFDRIEIRPAKEQVGFMIFTTSNTFSEQSTENCLGINDWNNAAVFADCELYSTHDTLWDIIPAGLETSEFRICHRHVRKCALVDENKLFGLVKLGDVSVELQLWELYNSSLPYPLSVTQYDTSKDFLSLYQSEILRVNVALFCDQSCGELFNYKKTKIENYWQSLLLDSETKLQSISHTTISISVTSVTFLWDLPANSDISFASFVPNPGLHIPISNWTLKELHDVGDFNIAVLASRNASESTLQYESNRKIYNYTNLGFIGTIKISLDKTDKDQCQDITDILSILYGEAISEKSVTVSNCLNLIKQQSTCEFSRYLLSECQELMFAEFSAKSRSSEGNESKKLAVSVLDLSPQTVKLLSLEDQCEILSFLSKILQLSSETCDVATCIYTDNSGTPTQTFFRPFYKTTCEPDKYCFRGRCIHEGFEIQHVKTGKCLWGINDQTDNDYLTLNTCDYSILPTHSFRIKKNEDNTTVLYTPYTSLYNNENTEKCLTANADNNILEYESCSTLKEEGHKFRWQLSFLNDSTVFVLVHQASDMCVYAGDNPEVPRLKLCNTAVIQSHWTFLPKQYFPNPGNVTFGYNFIKRVATTFLVKNSLPSTMFLIFEPEEHFLYYLYIVTPCIFVIIIVAVVIVYIIFRSRYKSRHNGVSNQVDPELSVPHQSELTEDLEIPLENLKLGKKLGSGAFGSVFEADVVNTLDSKVWSRVAVKVAEAVIDLTSVNALASELKIMTNIGAHLNVVKMLGTSTKSFPHDRKLYVVLEFCENGDLLKFLHKNQSKFTNLVASEADFADFKQREDENICRFTAMSFNTTSLVSRSYQIARGMQFLSSRRILHGDLAARNILLTEDFIAKISDFGFSKHLSRLKDYNYQKSLKGGRFPFKWMALESIKHGHFSYQSDCWSYGILLWEMFSLGTKPYPGIEVDKNFVKLIENGHRMERPDLCSEQIYELMLQCWHKNPDMRPASSDLVQAFADILGSVFVDEYAKLETDYEELFEVEENTELPSSTHGSTPLSLADTQRNGAILLSLV